MPVERAPWEVAAATRTLDGVRSKAGGSMPRTDRDKLLLTCLP